MSESRPTESCGCGAVVPVADVPTHPYIGASPGCWKIYGDVLGREYGDLRNPAWHRLTVDAYAVQHPGTESRRARQSVAIHLIALHWVIDQGLEPRFVTRRMAAAVSISSEFVWLVPPSFAGTANIVEVAAAISPREHEKAVHRWARSVWSAWGRHHPTIRQWARLLE